MAIYATITVDSNKDLQHSRDRVETSLSGMPFEVFTLQRADKSIDLCIQCIHDDIWEGHGVIEAITDRLSFDKIHSHVELWNPEEGEMVLYKNEIWKFKVCRLSECCIASDEGDTVWVPNSEISPFLMFNI